jgi:UDP-hydrolysing UDP-N-acetyl-D-glucosamine 2-epimerase
VQAPRKICVVTGSRAEFGLLSSLLRGIEDDPDLSLQLVVTGMHLSPEFGSTYREIESDGFRIDAKVETLLSGDSSVSVAKSMGLGLIGFADAFERLQPDLLILPGDRYEILAAAQAALVMRLPIAHLFGGDTTEGAFDEAIRHCITKMSHIHLVTNIESAARVRQLGEAPDMIHTVGTPAIDQIKSLSLMDRETLAADLDFEFRAKNLVVTFHPVTLATQSSVEQLNELLAALAALDDVGIVITKPNADPAGRALIDILETFAKERKSIKIHGSLGHLRYLSMLAQVDAVVGNSSSGLYEAPSFDIPTVNIGDRQKGRLQATSVFDCEADADDILRTLRTALETDCTGTQNPYGDGKAIPRIISLLKSVELSDGMLAKKFHWLTAISSLPIE